MQPLQWNRLATAHTVAVRTFVQPLQRTLHARQFFEVTALLCRVHFGELRPSGLVLAIGNFIGFGGLQVRTPPLPRGMQLALQLMPAAGQQFAQELEMDRCANAHD
jgi:hypothetical protein